MYARSPLRTASALLFVLGVARSAAADPGINNPGNYETFAGTVRESVVSQALATNARVFGIAGFLERVMFPRMTQLPGTLLVLGDMNQIYGVTRLPAECVCDDASEPYGLADVDTFATAGGVGYATEDWGLFYSASWNGAQMPDTALVRGMGAVAWSGWGLFSLYMSPFMTGPLKIIDTGELIEGSRVDYVLGGRGEVAGIQLQAGYLASDIDGGLYGNITEKKLRLLAAAALTHGAQSVSYLKSGFDRASWLLGQGKKARNVERRLSSLYARKLALVPPQTAASVADFDPADLRSVDLWTAHVEQLNLGPLDVKAALGVAPAVVVHEARATIHTEGFNPDPNADVQDEEAEPSAGITAGIVGLPKLYYYGVEGGNRFSFAAEGRMGLSGAMIAFNDPETLALFPYAQNAWRVNVHLDFSGVWAE